MSPSTFLNDWFEHVWNRGDAQWIRDHLADPCENCGMPDTLVGPEAFVGFQRSLLAAIDGLRVEVLECVEQGDQGMCTCRMTGTHRATGRPVSFDFASWVQLRGGRSVRCRNIIDYAALLQQVGDLPGDAIARATAPPDGVA